MLTFNLPYITGIHLTSNLFNYSSFLTLLSAMVNFFAWYPPKMSMRLEMRLGCSFQFKYQVPVETSYVELADHQLLHMH